MVNHAWREPFRWLLDSCSLTYSFVVLRNHLTLLTDSKLQCFKTSLFFKCQWSKILLMDEVLYHLKCIWPGKSWEKLSTSSGFSPDFFYQPFIICNMCIPFINEHFWSRIQGTVIMSINRWRWLPGIRMPSKDQAPSTLQIGVYEATPMRKKRCRKQSLAGNDHIWFDIDLSIYLVGFTIPVPSCT